MGLTSLLTECDCISYVFVGALLCLSAVYLFLRNKSCRNFPPGPRGLPIVGYAPFIGEHGGETLRKLKAKYGPVMSLPIGMERWVVLNDFASINECLVKNGTTFSGRPKNEILDMVSEGRGIILVDYGRPWKELRKFGLMTLRGFGVGKKGMEENIIEETPYLLDELTNGDGKSHTTKILRAVSNIICRVTFGTRYEYDDETYCTLIRVFQEFFKSDFDATLFGIMTAVPFLRHFPVFKGSLKRSMSEFDVFIGILSGIIKTHRDSFDQDNIRDIIDSFLAEMDKRGPGDDSFNEKQLLQFIRDLFEAGTGTTSTTLMWGILALVNYPECQNRIAQEIENTIGDSGLPSMKHRDQMNYTCAFIHELMRHRTLVPNNLMHKTNAASNVGGYTIPKDTTIIPNIWSVHYDPDIFENPEAFRPERFLNDDGKFVKSSRVIPFSIGPRHCLGEQLAQMELFIFFTGIIQKLKILPDPSSPLPPLNSGVFSFLTTYEPPEFKVLYEKR